MLYFKRQLRVSAAVVFWAVLLWGASSPATDRRLDDMLYDPGPLKPVDSVLAVKVGDPAPSLSLPSIS